MLISRPRRLETRDASGTPRVDAGMRGVLRAVARAASTSRARAATLDRGAASKRHGAFDRAFRRFSSSEDDVAARVRSKVRAGEQPDFMDVAGHVFARREGASARTGGGRERGERGWDWHAWQLLVACVPAAMSYACVMYIDKNYVPVYVNEMEARERAREAKIMETTAPADARRDEEATRLRARLAELEASVREVGARMASLEQPKPSEDAQTASEGEKSRTTA